MPTPPATTSTPCGACGARQPEPGYPVRDLIWGEPGTWRFVRCGRCGHGYLDPRPDDAALGALYGGLYTPENLAAMEAIGRSGFDRRLRRARLRAIRGAVQGPVRRVVDVGCGLGEFLAELSAAWPEAEAVGVEMAEPAAERAATHPGVVVQRVEFGDADLPEGGVDVLCMNHLLEHLPDPPRALARAARLVRPGGLVEVEVPRLDGWGRRLFRRWYWPHLPPQHLQVFSAAGLEALLAEQGFPEVVARRTSSYPMLASTTLVLAVRYTVGSRSPHAWRWWIRGPVVLLGFLVLPLLVLFDLLVAPVLGLLGLGDVVMVVARRA